MNFSNYKPLSQHFDMSTDTSILGRLVELVDTSLILYDHKGEILPSHDECNSCFGHSRPAIPSYWKVPVKSRDTLQTKGDQWVDMYHGTSIESMECILREGIDAKRCDQPSFGHGIYFSPCPRLAASFAVDGLILCCKINTKSILYFDSYMNSSQNKIFGQEHDPLYPYTVHALADKTEYIVFQPQNVVCEWVAQVNSTLFY